MLLSNSAGHGIGAGSEIGREEEVEGGGREVGEAGRTEEGPEGGGERRKRRRRRRLDRRQT